MDIYLLFPHTLSAIKGEKIPIVGVISKLLQMILNPVLKA